jgi:hypothetical protein
MRKSRFTDERTVKILREADAAPVPEVAKKYRDPDQTLHVWRQRFIDRTLTAFTTTSTSSPGFRASSSRESTVMTDAIFDPAGMVSFTWATTEPFSTSVTVPTSRFLAPTFKWSSLGWTSSVAFPEDVGRFDRRRQNTSPAPR